MPLLEVANVTKRFGGIVALDGVSFAAEPGEIVGLIGPNGAGKTSLVDAITGFTAASGLIVFRDEAIDHLDERWPGLRDRLVEPAPKLRPHINVYVDRERSGLDTELAAGSRLDVITAISGG